MRWAWLLPVACWPVPGWAVCVSLSLANLGATQTFTGSGGGDYNPYDGAAYPMTVSFNVTSLASLLPCQYFVAVSAGQGGNGGARRMTLGADTLGYGVYTDASRAFALLPQAGGGAAANYLSGSFPPVLSLLQSKAVSFVWLATPLQAVRASGSGFYSDSVTVGLYEGQPGDAAPPLRDSMTVTFRARVAASVDVAVVNSGAPFTLASTTRTEAFGNAVSGASRAFDIVVRSNSGYRVSVQSLNGQKLVHSAAPTVTSTIPYTLQVNGAGVDLSAANTPVAVASAAGAVTPATGTSLPAVVTLGTLSGHEYAGTYADTLGLTVTAQ